MAAVLENRLPNLKIGHFESVLPNLSQFGLLNLSPAEVAPGQEADAAALQTAAANMAAALVAQVGGAADMGRKPDAGEPTGPAAAPAGPAAAPAGLTRACLALRQVALQPQPVLGLL